MANAAEKMKMDKMPLASGIHFFIILAYVVVEFFPAKLPVIDNVGVHWLYLGAVNVLATFFLIARNELSFSSLKSWLSYAYFTFCGLSALSVFSAFNQVEWLVTFSRVAVTAIMFINCAVILNNNRRLYRQTILLLIASGSVQALVAIFYFLQGTAVETITLGLGNKNILAASLMVKLGFALMSVNAASRLLRPLILAAMAALVAATYILAARTTIFGMFILLAFYIITTLATKRARNVRSAFFITLVVFGAISVQTELWSRVATNMYNKQTVAERVISIREEVVIPKKFSRAVLWGFAFDFALHNPIFGGGLGNWKINSIPYETKVLANNFHSKHAHNDILEIAADTGFPGSLVYLSIFGVCGWFLVRIIKTREMQGNDLLFAVPCAGMIAYLCDANFNFPLERANMQMLFAVTLALNHSNFRHFFPAENAKNESPWAKRSGMVILPLAAILMLSVSWRDFRSMQGQFLIQGDMAGSKKLQYSYEEIEPYFTTIPNITATGIPVADIKAKYLLDENRDDEALQMVAADGNSNPHMPFRAMILGTIHRKKNDLDSAYHYFSRAHELAPLVYTYYAEVQKINAIHKDSIALKRNFAEITRDPQEAKAWIDMALWLFEVDNNNIDAPVACLEDGQKRFPANKDLQFNMHYLKALYHCRKENFGPAIEEGRKALQLGETYPVIQNLGLAYFGDRKYDKALPYFDMAVKKYGARNGESLYFRGQCYYIAYDMPRACADFKAAATAKYPIEPTLLQLCK